MPFLNDFIFNFQIYGADGSLLRAESRRGRGKGRGGGAVSISNNISIISKKKLRSHMK